MGDLIFKISGTPFESDDLLQKVKSQLILEHNEDDELIKRLIRSAVSYAESFQHLKKGYYGTNDMPPSTEHAIVMLTAHFYESRDGGTGGFFADSTQASNQTWITVNNMLRLDREWQF